MDSGGGPRACGSRGTLASALGLPPLTVGVESVGFGDVVEQDRAPVSLGKGVPRRTRRPAVPCHGPPRARRISGSDRGWVPGTMAVGVLVGEPHR